MPTIITRLEQMLTLWEQQCYRNITYGMIGLKGLRMTRQQAEETMGGPEKHWREFRRYVLRFRGGEFDQRRFISFETWDRAGATTLAFFPSLFAAWMAFSRHVFNVTPDLQALFELTSMSNLCWKDVPWPYDAFAINFQRPIEDAEGVWYDMALVNLRPLASYRPAKQPLLEMLLLPMDLGDFLGLDGHRKKRIDHLLETGKLEKAGQELVLTEVNQSQLKLRLPLVLIPGGSENVRISDMLDNSDDGQARKELVQASAVALRVLVGLCVYLAGLPPKHSAVRIEGPEPPADPEIRAITSCAHVCTVLSNYTLTSEEQAALGPSEALRQYHQLSPHWRRGHYRREPGQGHNPMAPRCIWVRPTLVRADLLRPGTQTGGAFVEVE